MWRAYLIETMSGLVGAEVEMSTNGRFDIILNGTGNATVTVQKSSLEGITKRWLRPWAQGFLLTLESEALGEVPVFAGPITAPPDEYTDSLSFSVSGIRVILEQRYATVKDFDTDLTAMKASKLEYKNYSLAGIAQDLVRRAIGKEGGYLPIRFATNPGTGTHTRTYHGYDLENNRVDKRLSELSDVIGGPDIMFVPEWVSETRQHIRWAMYTGTPGYPAIVQNWTMVFDAGAPESQISELSMNVDGSHYATRHYATGTGEGAGIVMRMSQNKDWLKDGHPLLENSTSYPSVGKGDTLAPYARQGVVKSPLVELHATVDIADQRSPIGRWMVGHEAIVKPGPWHTIPDLEKPLRILRVAGDFDTTHATIYFQEEYGW